MADAEMACIEHLRHASPSAAHLEPLVQFLDVASIPSAHLKVHWINRKRNVSHQRHHGEIGTSQRFVGGHVLAQLWGQLIEVGIDAVEISIGGEHLRCSLLPDTGDSRQVVRTVTAHGGQHRITLWLNPGALDDPGLVIERVVTDPALVVEHPHIRVLHQLEAISVARHHHHRPLLVA